MIHAFPGMGADRRMYPAPWSMLPGFVAHDWVPHRGEQSIADVARTMCDVCGVSDGDVLIGASLGGVVACEMTKLRRIPMLFLVGSAVRRDEVNPLLSLLHPLARVAPIEWLQVSARGIPADVVQMFATVDASFLRAMCTAIFTWENSASSNTRVFRLHGKRDLAIPPPSSVDLLLDGGHVIAMSHATECAEFVRRALSAVQAPALDQS